MAKPRTLSVWTIDEPTLRHIVDTSETQSEAIERCGSRPKGTAPFRGLQARCYEFGIDLEPLRRRSRSKVGRTLRGLRDIQRIPLSDILIEHSSYSRGNLKKRLIADGLLINECVKCGCPPEWSNEPLVMVLDHINGVPDDHRIENLRLLCPNCNSQTPTFSGKSKQRYDDGPSVINGQMSLPISFRQPKKPRLCVCGAEIGDEVKSGLCYRCACLLRRKAERPTSEELSVLISTTSMVKIGQRYGVSDNAVRKWAKSYGLL